MHVVQHNRLPKARRLGETHVARDGDREHLRPEVLRGLVRHLLREIEPRVVHREKDAIDREGWVEVSLHEFHGIEELRQALERVVLALDRNEHAVGGREHVEGQQAERRGTVDYDVLILLANVAQRAPHHRLASVLVHELDLGADQILRRRHHVETGEVDVIEARLGEWPTVEQRVIQRMANTIAFDADAARRVGLGIRIDQERLALRRRERSG